jgi:hypothetical protein
VLNRKRRGVSGFSLIELLIVVAIHLDYSGDVRCPNSTLHGRTCRRPPPSKRFTTIHVAQALVLFAIRPVRDLPR